MAKYWTDDQFIDAVKKFSTISDVLVYLNVPKQTYYFKVFHKEVSRLGLSTEHFTISKQPDRVWSFDDVFCKNSEYRGGGKRLKEKLFKNNLLENKCSLCEIGPEWNNKKLSLQLDHINGSNTDNRVSNLRLLCPNCHSQTDTFSGAKRNKERHAYKFVCKSCGGSKKTAKSIVCDRCNRKR